MKLPKFKSLKISFSTTSALISGCKLELFINFLLFLAHEFLIAAAVEALLGYKFGLVPTLSMWPVHDRGDLSFIHTFAKSEQKNIQVGDQIVFQRGIDYILMSHRCMDKRQIMFNGQLETAFITKGDANIRGDWEFYEYPDRRFLILENIKGIIVGGAPLIGYWPLWIAEKLSWKLIDWSMLASFLIVGR
ncbi:Signal_peptidase complex catalytic subunit SEC11 [Hexamita inflata]|uniref:Signal peptidase complex catalytic subunit SEC11 n=1 Tax=Hexamita inflata TaxID=28002 RepID=A0AA86TM11_9EUKA|nr:Signal peptidase complex catalytic subunit SEC11 [Hexamita inflata]